MRRALQRGTLVWSISLFACSSSSHSDADTAAGRDGGADTTVSFDAQVGDAARDATVDLDASTRTDSAVDSAVDAARDARADASTCGILTCSADQLCLRMRYGGPARCVAPDDAGTCPPAQRLSTSCPNLPGGQGCMDPSEARDQAVTCVATGGSCGNAPSCACLPSDVCAAAYGDCFTVQQRDVICASAAP
jgi:hypothetical protein